MRKIIAGIGLLVFYTTLFWFLEDIVKLNHSFAWQLYICVLTTIAILAPIFIPLGKLIKEWDDI